VSTIIAIVKHDVLYKELRKIGGNADGRNNTFDGI